MSKKRVLIGDKDDIFLIDGGSFRLLVGDLYELYCSYFHLVRKLSEIQTEKEFLRLQKNMANYERRMQRYCKRWGLPTGGTPWAYNTLEKSLREQNLLPAYPPQERVDL